MPHVILYDGVCGLCDRFVQFVLPRDRGGQFRFAAIQSDQAQRLLERHGRAGAPLDTIFVVVEPGTPREQVLERSAAGFFVLRALGGGWRLLAALRVLPRALTDFGYDLVARVRYRIFGKLDVCRLPRAEWKDRFLE